ncbi:bifunctional 5,10-methylene-tetrahydrofolate dehydrogenase/5,10-methylene-tetrahydrofolate cyclohydrolase, partial [Mycobacterium tuberculosis]|nr:bifunctional 5,10-methylene-tetrahydrofolate dehydrogenase/5,10-methylene-tetrahydrofolate cyclohydrolase [Mycobacterium tuberculosis]
ICQVTTRALAAETRRAEVVFVAVGKPGLIGADHIAPGAVVIDIGINRIRDATGGLMIVGDVDAAAVTPIAAALSLVPDGVGPLTT